MNIFKLIIRSLFFYRKQQLAVLAGTILSTAVLTGALIIGDSVKGSLRQMVDLRLGKTKYALITGDRFVRSQLAYNLANELKVHTSPLLAAEGIAINTESNQRINKAKVYGIEKSFWQFSDAEDIELTDNEVLISENIARKLSLKKDDELLLRIENAEVIPLNAPFASQENHSVSLRLTIKAILDENQLGRFSIRSDQKAPYNIFLSRNLLAEKLELNGLSNLILIANNGQIAGKEQINKSLSNLWQTEDISLHLNYLDSSGSYELSSERIFIDEQISNAIEKLEIPSQPVLTYLVNEISKADKSTPYSFVAAADQIISKGKLAENEIIINSWMAEDLAAKPGDSLNLKYYIIGSLRKLQEKSKTFIVKDIIPTKTNEALKSLMPSFPGLSNAGHCRDWETGVPIDLDKIRDKDEAYWNEYKGTPKAYISLKAGQKLWQNQFGKLTALRFDSTIISPSELKRKLIAQLHPGDFNLSVQSVYEQGVSATVNAVDFGELFLSLSFFVIVAGVLLTLLLHALNTESRSSETGVLAGLGFSKKMILKIRIWESVIIAVLGGILGAFVGILYNYAMLIGLNSVWYDVVRTNMISIFIKPSTLAIGAFSGALIGLLSIYFVSKKKLKQPIAFLIKNKISLSAATKAGTKISKIVAIASFLVIILILAYSFATSIETSAGLFLSAGGLVLIGFGALIHWYFKKPEKTTNTLTINELSIKNSIRNTSRSLTTIILLALGTFVILITGANRQTFYGSDERNQSGTGGYLFWAETSMSILEDLNNIEGKEKLGISGNDLPPETHFMQFHNLEGDDASCLNLNQVQKPQILGINAKELQERMSFSFAKIAEGIENDKVWASLSNEFGENVIPAIIDQTVLVWGLKKAVGDTLVYLNEEGKEIKLLIIAGLNNSIFQGNVMIDDRFFTKHFPSVSGSKIMLVDANSENTEQISKVLNSQLVDYGIEVQKTTARLNEFNSVTNTYLAVFMILGGLGVLIGTIGLGIVLLRNMIERKPELALMTAIGFTKKQLFNLVLKENLFLLFMGIGVGIFAAIIGILPSILSPSFEIPGTFVFVIIVIVLLSGFLWIYFPTKAVLKSVPIKALRRE
jgi:putative ABC transport system permease protein